MDLKQILTLWSPLGEGDLRGQKDRVDVKRISFL